MSAKSFLFIKNEIPNCSPSSLQSSSSLSNSAIPLDKINNNAGLRAIVDSPSPDFKLVSSLDGLQRSDRPKQLPIKKESAVSLVNDLTALLQGNDEESKFNDVKIILINSSRPISTNLHSSILKSRSKFFKHEIDLLENNESSFKQKFKVDNLHYESEKNEKIEIKFTNVKTKAFQDLVKFLYTGKVNIDDDTKIELFEYAFYFGVASLKRVTLLHLVKDETKLTISEALEILKFITKSDTFAVLKKKCIHFLKMNNRELIETLEWEEFCTGFPCLVAEILREDYE